MDPAKQTRIITYSKHHEVCLGYKYTQLILPIPLHVTPAFATDLGTVSSSLKSQKFSLYMYIHFSHNRNTFGHTDDLCDNQFFVAVCLKWRLHFEFVTSLHKGLNPPGENDTSWHAPPEVPIETMVWSLPIRLYSTTPNHVTQGVQGVAVHKLVIR